MTEQNNDAPAPEAEAEGPSVFDIFETDRDAEEQGKWFNIFGDRANGEIKIRGFASKTSLNVRRRLEAKYRRHMGADGTYPMDVMQKMVDEQLAEAIIIDWRGSAWRSKEGPIPFSKENVLAIIQKAPHLRNKIAQLAGDLDAFRAAEQEAISKN